MTTFRLSSEGDVAQILPLIDQAKAYLASQGIDQWQDGYPNGDVVHEDIRLGQGYVLEEDGQVLGILTLVFGGEPTYEAIYDGAWTTPEPYACFHRIAVSAAARGKGAADAMMQGAEAIAREKGMAGVRIDTHHDNIVMQRMLMRNGFVPCGTIYLQGGREHGAPRLALEKALSN